MCFYMERDANINRNRECVVIKRKRFIELAKRCAEDPKKAVFNGSCLIRIIFMWREFSTKEPTPTSCIEQWVSKTDDGIDFEWVWFSLKHSTTVHCSHSEKAKKGITNRCTGVHHCTLCCVCCPRLSFFWLDGQNENSDAQKFRWNEASVRISLIPRQNATVTSVPIQLYTLRFGTNKTRAFRFFSRSNDVRLAPSEPFARGADARKINDMK